MKNVDKYVNTLSKLKTDRSTFDNYWQEVATYCMPRHDFTTTRTAGNNRMDTLYTSIGIDNAEALAAALHSMGTPDTYQWFRRKLRGKYSKRMQAWAERTAEQMYEELVRRRNMMHLSLHEAYINLVNYGNGPIFIARDGDKLIFQSKDLRDCWVKEDDYGVINTIYNENKMACWEVIERFGEENVHRDLLKDKRKEDYIRILHVVEPREVAYGRGAVANKKPFSSVYIDLDNKHILRESGFDTFPYVFARFSKRSGEVYGYGPSMNALPSVKEVNRINEVMKRAAAKAVDGPILSPAEGLIGQPRLDAGEIMYYDPDMPEPKPWNNSFRPDYFEYILSKHEEAIRNFYFTNWMSVPRQPNMTATEVIQRTQESLRMLAPMLARLHTELHAPMLDRAFELLFEMKLIEPAPEEYNPDDLMWEFVSQMDQAARMSSANNVLQGLGLISQAAVADPMVTDEISFGRLVTRGLIKNYDWPQEYFTTEDEKQARLEARQNQQQMAQMQEMSEVASNTAGAVKGLSGVL